MIARALERDSTIGDRTSLAHHALIRGSEIGGFAFVGFQAEVVDATVTDGALISAGSYVEGVTIPEDALLAPGTVVTDQATADVLPTVEMAEEDFKRAVLEVNAEFAEGYDAVVGVGPNPETEFNPESVEPQIGAEGEIGEFARVVGDVRLGADSEVSDRVAIRADEGAPTVIGENAEIDERVTFHALEETSITVGNNVVVDDDTVLHGPLEAGDNLTVEDDSVVFRVVGDNVTVGEDVVIQGPASETEDPNELTLAIPDGAVIPDEASLEEALSETPGDARHRRREDGVPARYARPLVSLPGTTGGGPGRERPVPRVYSGGAGRPELGRETQPCGSCRCRMSTWARGCFGRTSSRPPSRRRTPSSLTSWPWWATSPWKGTAGSSRRRRATSTG